MDQSLRHPEQGIRLYRSTEYQEIDSRVTGECYLTLRVFIGLTKFSKQGPSSIGGIYVFNITVLWR